MDGDALVCADCWDAPAAGMRAPPCVPALAPALEARRNTRPPPPLAVDLALDGALRLRLLPGVGPARAQALLDDRRLHGAPRTSRDLLRVPGFGPARVAALVAATEVRSLLAGRPLEALPEVAER